MTASAAEVIYQLLIDLGIAEASDESDGLAATWSIYISFLPDKPDVALAVYDTAGTQDGRIMDGPKIEHPGIQVVVRTPTYDEGWQKARDIADAFDDQVKTIVAVESDTSYILHNVSRTGNTLPVGMDENDSQRRHYFTINAIITYAQET